jgi:hypothetical protein
MRKNTIAQWHALKQHNHYKDDAEWPANNSERLPGQTSTLAA